MAFQAKVSSAQRSPSRNLRSAAFEWVSIILWKKRSYLVQVDNPFLPSLRSGHRLFQRPSPGKQFPSNKSPLALSANGDCHDTLLVVWICSVRRIATN